MWVRRRTHSECVVYNIKVYICATCFSVRELFRANEAGWHCLEVTKYICEGGGWWWWWMLVFIAPQIAFNNIWLRICVRVIDEFIYKFSCRLKMRA